ncbi:MAG TPA: hypothetical protein VFE51_23010 [Verrucomicrobiae bacterium]|nr:hypothetical protein [Verrucomicrobiae bacterium]
MPQKAHVTSLEALEAFRSNLIVYLSQARPALDEISSEVLRTRSWLEGEQRVHWENQMRRRLKDLEQAQQALFSARLGILRKETAAEQMAMHRAKAAVVEADEKLRIIKKWDREFDGRVQPLVKQTEKLHTVLSNDMVKAVAYLTQAINTLAAYADSKAPASPASIPALTGTGNLEPQTEAGGSLQSSPPAPHLETGKT